MNESLLVDKVNEDPEVLISDCQESEIILYICRTKN